MIKCGATWEQKMPGESHDWEVEMSRVEGGMDGEQGAAEAFAQARQAAIEAAYRGATQIANGVFLALLPVEHASAERDLVIRLTMIPYCRVIVTPRFDCEGYTIRVVSPQAADLAQTLYLEPIVGVQITQLAVSATVWPEMQNRLFEAFGQVQHPAHT